ncbi:MAG TPA: hypothetical protein VNM37_08660, partial [Candidatus Dormibacteraeota bacterium]|nr:hypothetical protein [Candidatus Dormibacteraeota bacterium]
MLVMRTLDQPLAQLDGQERAADLGIKVGPDDHQASKETAKVFQGLIRKVEVDSHAQDAYEWGWKRMRACGRGYWRVNKAMSRQTKGDQVLRIVKIWNGASVYCDPLGPYQDQGGQYSDPCGEFTFITSDVPEATYKRLWGKSKLATAVESELAGLGDAAKEWIVSSDTGQKVYRVAEYFFATYPNGVRTIMWAKMNGVEWLDPPQEWDGHYIPVALDIGNEFNIGGQVIIEGMVQPSESPCLMTDYVVSWMAEKLGLSTMAPWVGISGQFQGFEGWWDQANVRNFSKLEYNAVTAATGGQLLPPPQRVNDE